MTKEKRLISRSCYEYVNVSDFQIAHLYIDKWTDVQEAAINTELDELNEDSDSEHSYLNSSISKFSETSEDNSEPLEKK